MSNAFQHSALIAHGVAIVTRYGSLQMEALAWATVGLHANLTLDQVKAALKGASFGSKVANMAERLIRQRRIDVATIILNVPATPDTPEVYLASCLEAVTSSIKVILIATGMKSIDKLSKLMSDDDKPEVPAVVPDAVMNNGEAAPVETEAAEKPADVVAVVAAAIAAATDTELQSMLTMIEAEIMARLDRADAIPLAA